MRKLIVNTFMTLDGVMQAPGAPEEDPGGGFEYGGWAFGYWDEVVDEAAHSSMADPFDLLLGRKTYRTGVQIKGGSFVEAEPERRDAGRE